MARIDAFFKLMDDQGVWQVDAANLEAPHIQRLIRD